MMEDPLGRISKWNGRLPKEQDTLVEDLLMEMEGLLMEENPPQGPPGPVRPIIVQTL